MLLVAFLLAAFAACDEEPVAPTAGPQVAITFPEDQSIRLEGELVHFSGLGAFGGSDLSDEIVWSSDVDGSIGSGASLNRLLSVGTHTISATIPPPDRNLLSGSTSMTLRIGELEEYAGFELTSVTTGLSHSCGLASDGVAYCWGNNTWGQLGDGTTTHSGRPVAVAGGHTFTNVSAGGYTTCGVDRQGAGYCWGHVGFGSWGGNSSTPVPIPGDHTFTEIDAGAHTCGVVSAGVGYCWGWNHQGQLGNGTESEASGPVQVASP